MDTYISQMQNVISALTSYFANMKDHIKNNHPNRYTRLDRLDYDNSKLFEELSKLGKSNTKSMVDTFHLTHLLQLLTSNLGKMYDTIQFPLDTSDDLTSTSRTRLSTMFNNITTIYKLFIKDVHNKLGNIIHELYNLLNVKDDYVQASTCFRKYPGSISLYIIYQSTLMNAAYRDKNKELQNLLSTTIENDKSYILEENEWTQPFLSFNLVPNGPLFTSVENMCAFMRTCDVEVTADTLEQLGIALEQYKIGLAVLNRPQLINAVVQNIPKLDIRKGINDDTVKLHILNFYNGKAGDWMLKLDDRLATSYVIVEVLNNQYRLLTPWYYRKLVVPYMHVHNLRGNHNDRPHRYNSLMTSGIMRHWNRHVYEFMRAEPSARDLDIKTENLQRSVIRVYREDKSKHPIEKKIIDAGVQNAFRDTLDSELGTSLHDARFYFVNDLCDQFVSECGSQINSLEIPTSREQELLVVEKLYHSAIVKVLKNNKPMFRVLPQNEYILKTISDIILEVEDLHPRRDPAKSSGVI